MQTGIMEPACCSWKTMRWRKHKNRQPTCNHICQTSTQPDVSPLALVTITCISMVVALCQLTIESAHCSGLTVLFVQMIQPLHVAAGPSVVHHHWHHHRICSRVSTAGLDWSVTLVFGYMFPQRGFLHWFLKSWDLIYLLHTVYAWTGGHTNRVAVQ